MELRLGTNAWGRLPDIPYFVDSVPGKLVNGALHWVDYLTNQVICFDVEEEEFKVVSHAIYKASKVLVQVAELEACLALVCREKRKSSDVKKERDTWQLRIGEEWCSAVVANGYWRRR
ncbi:hypothetical protein Sjap_021498 [Stephania japonica]|uniref:Uncharacterized protein n=1 Tax=Stephania japonica TaxID=461633 RepID=A0AAP0HTI8_9MAGN